MFKTILLLGVVDPSVITWDTNFSKNFCDYVITARMPNMPAQHVINNNKKLTLSYKQRLESTKAGTGHRGFFESVRRNIENERNLLNNNLKQG